MADGTIKEFLVSIGWKSNDTQQTKFFQALEGATLRANLLGTAIEDAARKVYESVVEMATRFDDLYWASQRTKASVDTIQAFGYAVSQLGGSSSAATASLETMAQKLREMPGNIVLLNKLGFQLNATTGQLEFNADLAAKNASSMTDSVAEIYRGMVGLDENTFLAIRRHSLEIGRLMTERETMNKSIGFDPDKAAVDSNKFMTVWRDAWERIGVFSDKGYQDLQNDLLGPFQEFDTLMKDRGPEIAKNIAVITKAIADALSGLMKLLEKLQQFDEWSKSLWFTQLLNKLTGQQTGNPAFDTPVAPLDDPGAMVPGGWGGVGGWLSDKWGNRPKWLGGSGAATTARGSLATNQQDAYSAARAEGLSDAAARALVANFSGESLANPGDRAGDGGQAQGIGQWHPDRAARIKAQFGKDPASMTTAEQVKAAIWEMKNTPAYADSWAAMQNGKSPNDILPTLVSNYERPADVDGSTAARMGYLRGLKVTDQTALAVSPGLYNGLNAFGGGRGANWSAAQSAQAFQSYMPAGGDTTNHVNQKVEIIVDGSGDPTAVAHMVGAHVDRANQDLAGNLQGAAQ